MKGEAAITEMDSIAHIAPRIKPVTPHRALGRAVLVMWVLLAQACAGVQPTPGKGPDTPVTSREDNQLRYQQAQLAYNLGDYKRAMEWLAPMADHGDPAAQYALGYMYFYGRGVPVDHYEALKWMMRAADQGYEKARDALRLQGFVQRESAPRPDPPANASQPPAPLPPPPAPTALDGDTADTPATPPPPPPRATPPPAKQPAAANQVQRVQDQPPDHFTIQVVGTHSEDEARAYIRRHNLEDQAAYFAFQRQGETWYAVVYGAYATRQQAEDALTTLAPALRSNGPWIRRFGDIQTLGGQIRAASGEVVSAGKDGPDGPPATQKAPRTASSTPPPAPQDKSPAKAADLVNSLLLAAQPSDHFTIQLVSSHDKRSAQAYAQHRHIEDQVLYFSFRRDNETWYAVVYGSYATRRQAEVALNNLDPSLRANGPWIRLFADIQKLK